MMNLFKHKVKLNKNTIDDMNIHDNRDGLSLLILLIILFAIIIGAAIAVKVYDEKNTVTKEEVMILKSRTVKTEDKKIVYTFENENKEEVVYENEEEIVYLKSGTITNTAFNKAANNILKQGEKYKVKYSIYKNKVTKVIEVTELEREGD